jgi:hypothetical protein
MSALFCDNTKYFKVQPIDTESYYKNYS